MPVKYALYPNPLTNTPNDHRAVVKHTDSHDVDDLIDLMIASGSTVTRAEALAVIEEYESAICSFMAEGSRINTSMFRISFSVSGVFTDEDDLFDPERHGLKLNISPGLRAKALTDKFSLKKVEASRPRPVLNKFTDVATDTTNQWLTPGGIGMMRGNLLKTDVSDAEQGVFIIGSDGTEVRIDQFIRNMPQDLIFTIPQNLPAGPCIIEVRAMLRHTTKIRTSRLDAELQLS